MKTELLYGLHPVHEAMQADRRRLIRLYLNDKHTGDRFRSLKSLAASRRLPVQYLPASSLTSLAASESHQGVCLRTGPYPLVNVSRILERSKSRGHPPFVLLLDGIVDPNNLGALIRTAVCAGLDGVVIPKNRAAAPTAAVSKASAGALEHIFLTRVTNMVTTIQTLKAAGLWIAGLEQRAVETLYATDLSASLAIVVGGEHKGLRPLVRQHCDFLVAIPQVGETESLNAAVAGGIVMYEALRQRLRSGN